jgi:hypothetical protein
MAIAGLALTVLGSIAMFVFTIQILITAFKTSPAWGLASLFIPFVILVFVAKNWVATKTPFIRSMIALVVVVVGSSLSLFGAMAGAAAQ